jgi:hypothetical protein
VVRRYGARVHVVRGLRQAALLLLLAAVVALIGAGAWTVVRDEGFRVPFAVALMLIGALIGVTSGTELSREGTNDARAFLGLGGPHREELPTGEGLTGVGIFLFVAVPLLVAGLVLYGTG